MGDVQRSTWEVSSDTSARSTESTSFRQGSGTPKVYCSPSGCRKRSAAKGVRSLFFFRFWDSFGHFLVTFSDASVTFFVTLNFCQAPFAGLLLRQGESCTFFDKYWWLRFLNSASEFCFPGRTLTSALPDMSQHVLTRAHCSKHHFPTSWHLGLNCSFS